MKLASAMAAAFLGACISTTAGGRPNVVVILTDDQGWGDLGLHGNRDLSTPNLDRLARAGARFERFYVCPVCSPTRAEFLTGRYHSRGGVYSTSSGGERLGLDEHTLAETFQAAGYATAAFGKWHNGMQYPYHPNGRGFDEFYGFCSGHWAHYFSPMLEHNGEIVTGNGYVTNDFTEHAIEFVETCVGAGRPFFVYLPYNTPHSPMQVPAPFWERFEDKELRMPHPPERGGKTQHTRAALAMCENIDWNVGRLLERIDTLGVREDTIVAFFHDNGPNGPRWNGGMRGRKGSTDEGGVRSPLFVRWSGTIPPDTVIEPIGAAIDLLPTLADLAGLEVESAKPLDGISLKPLLLGEARTWPARTIFSHWNGRVSARTDRYRLDDKGRLYDLGADPGQKHDLAGEKPEVAKRLRAEVAAFKRDAGSGLRRDRRPFLLGHPGFTHTQLPARDATPHGALKRSSRHPNCSHFTNWRTRDDKLTWPVKVAAPGTFAVDLYYTCPEAEAGSTVELRLGEASLRTTITDAFDPPYTAARRDRVPRKEGDDKKWKRITMGVIDLDIGPGELTLRALDIPGATVMDFRLLMFRRL